MKYRLYIQSAREGERKKKNEKKEWIPAAVMKGKKKEKQRKENEKEGENECERAYACVMK